MALALGPWTPPEQSSPIKRLARPLHDRQLPAWSRVRATSLALAAKASMIGQRATERWSSPNRKTPPRVRGRSDCNKEGRQLRRPVLVGEADGVLLDSTP